MKVSEKRLQASKEMNRRAKSEERDWIKGKRGKEKRPNLDGWELEQIILEHGCLIYRSTEYTGVRGQPMEDQDVGF